MMQRLVDSDQPPEPGMPRMDVEGGYAKALGAVDRDVNRKIDQPDEPETRRDDKDQRGRQQTMNKAVNQQRQRPSGLLVLAERHPGVLQEEIRDHVLDGEDQHPSDQRAYGNRRRH